MPRRQPPIALVLSRIEAEALYLAASQELPAAEEDIYGTAKAAARGQLRKELDRRYESRSE